VFSPQIRTTNGVPMLGLSDRFGAALVVTAIPGGPNDRRRLHKIEVSGDELRRDFRDDFTTTGGEGPDCEVYCPASIVTAWLAWRTTAEARETMGRLFGFGDPIEGTDYPGYELLNGRAMLPAIAKALAALKYAEFVDAWEGDQAGALAPDVVPKGNVESVEHSVDPEGRVQTRIRMPAHRRALEFLALVPPAMRSQILGTIQQGKA
jgi:hypothetical protein